MKKSSKSSLKKRSPNISPQHKNKASYKFSKKNFCTWPKKGLELKGLSGYLDVTRLVSRILGTWRCCGVMGIVSCVQGRPQTLVIIHHPLSEQGVGGLEGHTGLPALQPVPCLSGSCVGREGHGPFAY